MDLLPPSGRELERLRSQQIVAESAISRLSATLDEMLPADERPVKISRYKAVKKLTVILVLPTGRVTRVFRARPNCAWTPKGVEQVLDQVAGQLDRAYPGVDFRLAKVVENAHYNIIHPAVEKHADVKATKELTV